MPNEPQHNHPKNLNGPNTCPCCFERGRQALLAELRAKGKTLDYFDLDGQQLTRLGLSPNQRGHWDTWRYVLVAL